MAQEAPLDPKFKGFVEDLRQRYKAEALAAIEKARHDTKAGLAKEMEETRAAAAGHITSLKHQLASERQRADAVLTNALRRVAAAAEKASEKGAHGVPDSSPPLWDAAGVVALVRTCASAVHARLTDGPTAGTPPRVLDSTLDPALVGLLQLDPTAYTMVGGSAVAAPGAALEAMFGPLPPSTPWGRCMGCGVPNPPQANFCAGCGISTAIPAPTPGGSSLGRQSSMPQHRARAGGEEGGVPAPAQQAVPLSRGRSTSAGVPSAAARAMAAKQPAPAPAPAPPAGEGARAASASRRPTSRSRGGVRPSSRSRSRGGDRGAARSRSAARQGASASTTSGGLNAYLHAKKAEEAAAAAASATDAARWQTVAEEEKQRRSEAARRSGRRRGAPRAARPGVPAAVPTAGGGSGISSRLKMPPPVMGARSMSGDSGATTPKAGTPSAAAGGGGSSMPPPVPPPASTPAPATGEDGGPWIPAVTPEGVQYWWHRDTRDTRWSKPEGQAAAAMEARLAAEKAATQERAAARLAAVRAAAEDEALREEVREAVGASVGAEVAQWTTAAGWDGKGKGMDKGALASVLGALLSSLHTLPHLQRGAGQGAGEPYSFVAKLPATTAGAAGASAVGKVYLRAVRIVHPDKLPHGDGATVQMRLMSQAVFDTLTTVHNAMKSA